MSKLLLTFDMMDISNHVNNTQMDWDPYIQITPNISIQPNLNPYNIDQSIGTNGIYSENLLLVNQ